MITAVITGADHPTGLGTARCLNNLDCRILGLYSKKKSLCCFSKCWNELIYYENYSDIITTLMKIGKGIDGEIVLFITQDDVVKFVSDNRNKLSEFYKFVLPAKYYVDLLLDKTKFQLWAEKHRYDVPQSEVCKSQIELVRACERFDYQLIIKPFVKTEKWDKFSNGNKVLKINSKEDFDAINFEIFEAVDKLLVQQWIYGDDSDVYFCLVYYDKNGLLSEMFTGQKLLQSPPYSGSTAVAIGVENTYIKDVTKRLFDSISYRGLGSIEFKRSRIDGKYYIIEPTVGRNDLQSNVAFSGGVNLTQLAMSDVCAIERPANTIVRRGVWIDETGFIESMRFYVKNGEMKLGTLLKILRLHNQYALFSMRDVKPFREWLVAKLKRMIVKSLPF